MISSILLVLAVGAAIGGSVHLLKTNESAAEKGREWVEDSVTAWRSKELDPKQFDVRVEDVDLDDLFTEFDHDDGDPYLSPDGIEERLTEVTGSSLPKRVVDSTELAALRALEVAKSAKTKREAEAREKSDGSPSKSDIAAARVLAAKDVAVHGAKSAGRGAKKVGRGAANAGKSALDAIRTRRRADSPSEGARDDERGTQRVKKSRKVRAERPKKTKRPEPKKPAPKKPAPKRPAPKRAPSADTNSAHDILPPPPTAKKWPTGAPKLSGPEDLERRESA